MRQFVFVGDPRMRLRQVTERLSMWVLLAVGLAALFETVGWAVMAPSLIPLSERALGVLAGVVIAGGILGIAAILLWRDDAHQAGRCPVRFQLWVLPATVAVVGVATSVAVADLRSSDPIRLLCLGILCGILITVGGGNEEKSGLSESSTDRARNSGPLHG